VSGAVSPADLGYTDGVTTTGPAPIARKLVDASAPPLAAVRYAVGRIVRGKDEVIELALISMVAQGHLLIEDIPGVGKSTLARALAYAIGGEFRRIQFTSDLLPADLLGVNVWLAKQERFEFRPGPIFANVVLADEINRAPPRTQSALLEAMGEAQVSVDGVSHALPRPFLVLATQNPQEHHGTYPLPESQRDRFLMRLSMGYADADVEAELLQQGTRPELTRFDPVITHEQLTAAQAAATKVFVHEDIARYAQKVIAATRESGALRLGVSTRGALAWMSAARARAHLDGRTQVSIDDLQELAVPALAHRILPGGGAAGDSVAVAEEMVRDILAQVPVPV
jgi:MoxR-like ATPase